MKIIIFTLLVGILPAYAGSYAQETKLTIKENNIALDKLLKIIEAKTDFFFFYSNDKINKNETVNVNVKDKTIFAVLDQALSGTDITYQVVDKAIILLKGTSPVFIQQQNKTISGTVTDTRGEPLAGATVVEKGTTNGTVADADGKFSLTVSENATLQVAFVGCIAQEIAVGNQANLKIVLREDTQALEEIVVVGYGTRVKGALTGSIAKTDSKIFETRPVVDAVNALQGAMPGVTVIRGSTRPGYDQVEVQVRGYSSMSGSRPLVLIDGISGNLNLINPNDIENVTVLKDASASIYGARASDGVILVTTKKGKSGKPKFSYSGNFGVKVPQSIKRITTTPQLVDIYNEGRANMGLPLIPQDVVDKVHMANPPTEPDPTGWWYGNEWMPGFYGSTDPFDVMFGNGKQQNHSVTVSGGGENNTYLISGGFNRDEGFYKLCEQAISDRFNLSANNSFKNIFDRLDIDTRLQFDSRRTDEPYTADIFGATARIFPFYPVKRPSGDYFSGAWGAIPQVIDGGRTTIRNDRLTFNTKGELRIIDDLKFIGQYGVSIANNETKAINRTIQVINWDGSLLGNVFDPNTATYTPNYTRYSSYTGYLEYNKALGKHNVNVMVGAAQEENYYSSTSVTGRHFLTNDIFSLNLSDQTDIKYLSATSAENDWALTSYFGRLGYNYDMRYLVDFTLRADGSSKFAPDKRWSAVFPAVSAAWNLGSESFIRSMNVFDNLKLRLSWGQSGNQELSFGYYDYIPLVNINNSAIVLGETGVYFPGATSAIASRDRSWETITTLNAGVDFSTLGSRLSGSFEVYMKKNNDMLVRQDLPALFGGSAPTQNIGELETKGFDLMLGWRDKVADFGYGVSFMLSDSKNKLVQLLGSNTKAEGLVTACEGYSLYSYFGYVSDGIIKTEGELAEYKKLGGTVPVNIGIGDMKYRDLDGDGKITAFGDDGKSGDMTYLGNRLPRYTYSSNIDLSYKNVDLNLFLQGVGKREVVRTGDYQGPMWRSWFPTLGYFDGKTWTPDRPDAEFPRTVVGEQGWNDIRDWDYRYSDSPHRLISTAYMRVKLITLAYRLPQSFVSKLKLGSVRVYASGQDMFTFANGTWGGNYDPEEGWAKTDEQSYPFNKTISFGIDVKF
ncbi:MAG: TonB-dependent receptor [Tannerella sp.]|jgi:TonB-linked SusC/RagA family outer membrane protein|nr:TonB-dependent receptor [Tannerella sp.]